MLLLHQLTLHVILVSSLARHSLCLIKFNLLPLLTIAESEVLSTTLPLKLSCHLSSTVKLTIASISSSTCLTLNSIVFNWFLTWLLVLLLDLLDSHTGRREYIHCQAHLLLKATFWTPAPLNGQLVCHELQPVRWDEGVLVIEVKGTCRFLNPSLWSWFLPRWEKLC